MLSIKQSGFLGLLAAIVVGIGEFLLHYSPNILEIEGSFDFLAAVPVENFVWGHFFVLVGIPLYFIGYYHFYLMLKKGGERLSKIFFAISIIAFLCGGIWIASRAFIGEIIHIKSMMTPDVFSIIESKYLFYFENLLSVLRHLIFIISGLWIYLILSGKTHYPKWMSLFSPIILLFGVFTTLAIPSVGKYLIPIALNVAHFALFSLSLYIASRNNL